MSGEAVISLMLKRGESTAPPSGKTNYLLIHIIRKLSAAIYLVPGIKMCELMVIWCRCSKLCGVMQYSRFYEEKRTIPLLEAWEDTYVVISRRKFLVDGICIHHGSDKESSRNQYWIVRRLLSGGWWRQKHYVLSYIIPEHTRGFFWVCNFNTLH